MLPLYNVEVKTNITDNLVLVVAAGLLVGIGTRLANGCTSGPRRLRHFAFFAAGAWSRRYSTCWQAVSRWCCFRHVLGVI